MKYVYRKNDNDKILENMKGKYKRYFKKNDNFEIDSKALANDFLLDKIFKIKNNDNIVVKVNSKKTLTFTRENYYEIFNYNIFNSLAEKIKIKAFYWFYIDVCKELKLKNAPDFIFSYKFTDCSAYFDNNENSINIMLPNKSKETEEASDISAYNVLNSIAHELHHAKYLEDWLEGTNEFKQNSQFIYFDLPNEDNYDFFNERSHFKYLLEYYLYLFQPDELYAYNYGYEKAKKVFDKAKPKNKQEISLADLRHFCFEKDKMEKRQKFLENFIGIKNFKSYYKNRCRKYVLENKLFILKLKIKKEDKQAKTKNLLITLSDNASSSLQIKAERYNELVEKYKLLSNKIKKVEEQLFVKYKKTLDKNNKNKITGNFYEK